MGKSLVSISQKGEVVVLHLHEKRFYQHAVPELEDKVRMLIEQSRTKFCVDLSGVEVMNSSAIGILILLADYVKRAEGKMVVTGFNDLLEDLFKRMRLDTLFPLIRDQKKGIAVLNE
ncbi:STAS domain-containing protein [candidate division KSB1 bacterium]|nr:STAS domain-containing protein [candidate division KSB1 bacterium]